MDFLVTGDRSIFFYLLLFFLLVGVVQALTVGSLFFFKRSGDRRSNWFFGVLLITFGLTLIHNIFNFIELYEVWPEGKFLPLYFTLSFPVLLFFHAKLSLYPSYQIRWTDAKHFILPVGQLLFFVVMFLQPVAVKAAMGRVYFNPFYGAFEQGLYLTSFFAYLYFAYRYIRQRRLEVRRERNPHEWRKVLYLRTLVRVLLVLYIIHTVFVVTDFVYYEFLEINLRAVKFYVALGMLSFAALGYWMGTYGFQVLIWGRKVFGKTNG